MAKSYWEQYLIERLSTWISTTEKKWCEFKENCLDPIRIGEYVSALANGACLDNEDNGWLIFGIRESTHSIEGTKKQWCHMKVGNQDLELHLRQHLSPSVDMDLFSLTIKNTPILALRVTAARGEPIQYKGEAYIRELLISG